MNHEATQLQKLVGEESDQLPLLASGGAALGSLHKGAGPQAHTESISSGSKSREEEAIMNPEDRLAEMEDGSKVLIVGDGGGAEAKRAVIEALARAAMTTLPIFTLESEGTFPSFDLWPGLPALPMRSFSPPPKKRVIECLLPECKTPTNHNGGFCSGDHCREYQRRKKEKRKASKRRTEFWKDIQERYENGKIQIITAKQPQRPNQRIREIPDHGPMAIDYIDRIETKGEKQ